MNRCLFCMLARNCSFFMVTGVSAVNVTVVPALPFDRLWSCPTYVYSHCHRTQLWRLCTYALHIQCRAYWYVDPRGHGMRWMGAPPSSCLSSALSPVFFPIRFVSPCQKMDTYDQGNQWAGSKLGRRQVALIGIGRAALETASTAALPGVRLLCKLVFWYRHADTTVFRLRIIWEKCDGIPGKPVVSSYEEKRTTQFQSVDRQWISITFSGARWPYWKSNTTPKTSC